MQGRGRLGSVGGTAVLAILVAATSAAVSSAAAQSSGSSKRSAVLSAPAGTVTVGKAWSATLTVRPAQKAAPRVTARLRQRVSSFTARPLGNGRYRVRLVFPAAGTWKLAARTTRGARALRAVTVHKGKDKGLKRGGAVYTLTNDFGQNAVVAFHRYSNGLIVQRAVVPTGGKGGTLPQEGCPNPCPFLDDQGPLASSEDGRLLFAINPGSDTISSFTADDHGLKLVGQFNSGGHFPYSITTHDDVLYVLNAVSSNISGFRIAGSGKLTPIPGSTRPLSPDAMQPAGAPRQIGFDNTGKVLAVTLIGSANINTFVLDKKHVPGNAISNPATSPLPFGFSWDSHNHLVVSQVHDLNFTPTGDVATYGLTSSGHLTPIQTIGTQGFAPCWTDVSDHGYAYIVNTGAGAPSGATVSVFKVSPNGTLALKQVTPQVVVFPFPPPGTTEFAKTDIALSPHDDFAYVVVPGFYSSTSHIDAYSVNDDGTLTLLALTPSTLAGGLSGILTT